MGRLRIDYTRDDWAHYCSWCQDHGKRETFIGCAEWLKREQEKKQLPLAPTEQR
jgi:hypothetical protein